MENKGSTIIELLIVLIIIISVFSITLVADFPRAKLMLTLSQAAYTFEQNVRRAQLMSLSGPRYKDSHGILQPTQGYGVYVDTLDNKKYILYADGLPSNAHYDGVLSDHLVETIDFSKTQPGIIIKQINNITGNNVSINFSGTSPLTTITPSPIRGTVDIVFALEGDPSQTKTVSINTAGLIEVK